MITYKITIDSNGDEFIIKTDENGKKMGIPKSQGNMDYLAYLKWLDGYELQGMDWVKTSDGNTPLPADE